MRPYSTIFLLFFASACSNGFKGSGDGPDGQGNNADTSSDTEEDTDTDTDEDTDTVVGDIYTDDDGDGYTEDEGDCDDSDAGIAPNQAEECNGVDDNCDGQIDESGGTTLYYADNDGDTYGDPGDVTAACSQPAGYVTDSSDCDDDHSTAHPGGVEISWNDIDEDCDGVDYSLEGCVQEAVNNTVAEMTSSVWAIEPYEGTYHETITGYSFPVANWDISNQYLTLTEVETELTADDDSLLTYALRFDVEAGMNDSSYTGSYYETGYGDVYEGPFWIDVQTDAIYSYIGIDYATYCDAWVDPTAQGFAGSLQLSVNIAEQTITGDAQLSSSFSPLTAADVNTSSVSGEADCELAYIDLIIDQLGYGDTLGILDETFETTLTGLEATYEATLEANLTAACSAPADE